jgi:hypothetical protein
MVDTGQILRRGGDGVVAALQTPAGFDGSAGLAEPTQWCVRCADRTRQHSVAGGKKRVDLVRVSPREPRKAADGQRQLHRVFDIEPQDDAGRVVAARSLAGAQFEHLQQPAGVFAAALDQQGDEFLSRESRLDPAAQEPKQRRLLAEDLPRLGELSAWSEVVVK